MLVFRIQNQWISLCVHSFLCGVEWNITIGSHFSFSNNLTPQLILTEKNTFSIKMLLGLPRMSCEMNLNRGIKHDFPFINIRKVPRKVLKTQDEA